ncbi:MAG: hypothetical protein AMXMBFR12_00320 [Candidatus Babeliales bacterium]
MKQLLKLLFIFLVIAVLPACGPHYRKKSLSYLRSIKPGYSQTKDQMALEITQLNENDTNALFDGQGRKLKKIARPLYFRIINQSNYSFSLNPQSITLAQVSVEELQEAICYKKLLPIAGIVGAGALYIPLFWIHTFGIYAAVIYNYVFLTACLCASGALLLLATSFIIPATMISSVKYSNNVNHANQDLHEDIHEKTSGNFLKIPADTTQEFLFFANSKQFKNNFDVTFTEKITQKPLTFNVTL